MTTYIIKITCDETNKIFIASTINIKNYMKGLRKQIRKHSRVYVRRNKIGRPAGQLSDKLNFTILYEVEDSKEIFIKRDEAIKANPTCINDKSWSN